ncbi:hypothetical protein ACROYT_G036623 [Oculina patagonica]
MSRAKIEETRNKKQRSKLLFNTDTLSDVKFVVRASQHGENDSKRSKIEIPAHKFVLSICSPVFFRMFCGEMAESGEQIDLPDCDYEGLLELLRYIYTDEVCLNGNNVMQVLYLAEKYIVPCLVEECVKYLKANLDPSNVLCVLQHAQKYKKKDLLCQSWYLIDKRMEEVLKSSDFLTIEKSLLEQLVIRNSLNIKEVELFKAVDRWAGKECERQNLAADGSVKRQILGEQIVKNIRFPAMKQSDFMEVVYSSKILTEQETSDIMKHFSSPETPPVTLLEAERGGSCLRCCRSERSRMSSFLLNNPDKPHIIKVTVDKDIMLYGVALFGNNYAEYSVSLLILNNDANDGLPLATKNGDFTSFFMESETGRRYYGYDVLLDVPVTLKHGVNYCFKLLIEGPEAEVEGRVVNDVKCAGVLFEFNDPDNEEEDENFLLSQIAEVLFKLKN